ncbi:hypothetical protein FHS89_001760 [Rubricella aquisinus]|uniref:Uncharacterized protein n=1 Tax=Rubricella aquisinus TaxID=2028108 RepID=A0A840WX36_9RHOB|nr:hypothetical protein [Rubricella aquisinus]MBB5515740.1 hypothetical protein [Rubricella aquisinus]
MVERNWFYKRVDPDGGAGGEVFKSIFNGSGLDAAERLAREALQNSVDAAREGETPRVSLRMHAYSDADLDRFWHGAGLDAIAARVGVLGLHTGNAFETKPETLRVLHVVDSGTTGLAGDPTSPSSKMRKLLMEIGGSQKVVEEKNSGGSYGFGKAVYSASSRVAVIFAYSRTHDASGHPLSVLMGCAYHREHEFDGQATSGRAFFGRRIEEHSIPIRHDPFVGEEADELAAELNMSREEGDIGTTIAIVDCPLKMEDIKRGVERSWWPKIRRENFRVTITDEDGQRLHLRPLQDPELRPFIDALDVALGRSPEQSGKSRRKADFNKLDGKKIGQLGLFALADEQEVDEMSDQVDRRDTIALVRSPGMVVQYYRRGFPSHPPVVGVFLADDDIDDILRRSEPPEHDQWDANADRLDPSSKEREIVQSVHARIWRELRTFQKFARPPEKSDGNRFLQLERELAKLFGPTGKREPIGGGKGETPVSLRPDVLIEQAADGLKVKGQVTIQLKEDHEGDLPVIVTMRLSSIDEGHRHLDPIALTASFYGADVEMVDVAEWHLTLSPGEKVNVEVESAVYEPDWTVDFVPRVKPLGAEGKE